MNLSFLAIFAISFSVMAGVLWEFVEYSVGGAFGTNTQALLASGLIILSAIATIQLTKSKKGFAYSYFKKI